MAAQGYLYPVEQYPVGSGNLATIGTYPEAALVAEHGHLWADYRTTGLPPQPPAASIDDPNFQRQLGACFHEADAAIGRPDLERALAPFYEAAAAMSVSVNLEPDVAEAIDEWVDCMLQRGYPVTNLRSAEDLASNGGASSMTSKVAMDVAVADFACQRTVELIETLINARRRLVADWIDANPMALRDREDAIDLVIERCLVLVPD